MKIDFAYVTGEAMASVTMDEDALITLKTALETEIRQTVTHNTDIHAVLPLIKDWRILDKTLTDMVELKEKQKEKNMTTSPSAQEDGEESPLPF